LWPGQKEGGRGGRKGVAVWHSSTGVSLESCSQGGEGGGEGVFGQGKIPWGTNLLGNTDHLDVRKGKIFESAPKRGGKGGDRERGDPPVQEKEKVEQTLNEEGILTRLPGLGPADLLREGGRRKGQIGRPVGGG